MNIQEIPVSNNHKKHLLRLEELSEVMFQDDNGDLVVNVAAYQELKKHLNSEPIEHVLGDEELDYSAEYFVFT